MLVPVNATMPVVAGYLVYRVAPLLEGWKSLLIVALLTLGWLVMPKRLAQFWDSLVPPEVVLAKPKPLRRHEEAAIASRLSAELHAQTDRLRRGFRLTVALSSCGLVLAAVAYVIEKW